MSDDGSEVVTIRVLDKEYSVICPPGEREGLLSSAQLLDGTFREMRKSGKIIGTERMAVITALNAVHQVEKIKSEQAEIVTKAQSDVERMEARLNAAIARFKASSSSKEERVEQSPDSNEARKDLSTEPEWFGLASPEPLISDASDAVAEAEGALFDSESLGAGIPPADAVEGESLDPDPADPAAFIGSDRVAEPEEALLEPESLGSEIPAAAAAAGGESLDPDPADSEAFVGSDRVAESEDPLSGFDAPGSRGVEFADADPAESESLDPDPVGPEIPDPDAFGLDPIEAPDPSFPAPEDDDLPSRPT